MWHVNERRAQKPHYWATWECKYHVVFIPKYRKKAIFGVIKKRLGDVFHELARRRESKIEEGIAGCCAWAASGPTAAAPRSAMNSRRLM